MNKPELVRGLGLWGASSVVVGTVIGSGIFLVANDMARGVGTPGWVFVVWIFGGLLSLSGALAYAELSAMLPKAGGPYAFLGAAYGPLWGFLFGWMQFLIAKTGSIATLGAGFALYFTFFFPALNLKAVAFAIIAVLAIVNYFGVRTSGAVQTFFTVLKIGLIVGLAVGALISGKGDWQNLSSAVPINSLFDGFVLALVGALWAYDGWDNASFIGGEVSNPGRNLPLALVFGTMLVGVLYMLANLGYFYILSASGVAGSSRVAADVASQFMGRYGGGAVALAAMISIFAALNGSILGGSRIPYAMASDGLFFSGLAKVHPLYRSPSNSIVVMCALAAVMSLSGTYTELYTYVIFASWIFYGLTATAVFALRRKHPEWPRPYKAWGYPVLPAAFVLVSAGFAASVFWNNPKQSLIGLLIIAAGVPAYFFFKSRAKAAGAAVLLLTVIGAGRADARPAVLAFTLHDTPGLRSLERNARRLDILSPQSYVAHPDGRLRGQVSSEIRKQAAAARVRLMPAVVNLDFSHATLERLLASRKARQRLVRGLVSSARKMRYAGFVVDFEGFGTGLRDHYSAFLGEVRKEFRKHRLTLGVALPPPLGKNRETYDYQAIGRLADQVILMAYDQHHRMGPAGPIAGYNWVANAVEGTVALIPAEKVWLGLALYHRDWSEAGVTTGSHAEALSHLEKDGGELQWDEQARAPWFRSSQTGTTWLEDSRSISEKVALAKRFSLGGVAAWRLGQEDPEVWPVLDQYREQYRRK